jgi:hypothetical protein
VCVCFKQGGGGLAGEWGNPTFCLIFILNFGKINNLGSLFNKTII